MSCRQNITKILAAACIVMISVTVIGGESDSSRQIKDNEGMAMNDSINRNEVTAIQDVQIDILYDNYPHPPDKEALWGYSCLIRGTEKTILFDTGTIGDSLLANMDRADIDPKSIDLIVISHDHYDHTGGLDKLLPKCESPTVYLLESFSSELKKNIRSLGGNIVEDSQSIEICRNVFTTGKMGTRTEEQALILRTRSSLIVITGCAHPGVVEMTAKAKELLKDDILLVMGGFHLVESPGETVEKAISGLRELSVKYVIPNHCTGDAAREMFREAFGDQFLDVGVGSTIKLSDLTGK